MTPDHEFERTKESPTTFFRLSALRMAGLVEMEIGRVDVLVNILFGALGVEWLNSVAKDVPGSIPLPLARHPIGRMMATAGEAQVVEALELAGHLELLYDVPGLDGVIEQLRSANQYWQTLLHLVVAAKLRARGASDMRLEPPAAEGRLSDIGFVFGGKRYQAECYRPTYLSKGDEQNEMTRLAKDLLDLVDERKVVVSFAISLTTPVNPELRKELVRAAREMLLSLWTDISADPSCFPCLALEGDFGILSICRALPTASGSRPKWVAAPTFPQKVGEPPFFMRASVANVTDLAGLDSDFEQGIGLSHVAVWGGLVETRDDPTTELNKFGHKLERKLKQTRTTPEVGRILFADAKESLHLKTARDPEAMRLRGKLIEQHDDIAGVVLVKRPAQPREVTPKYHAVALLRDGSDSDLVDLLSTLFLPPPGSDRVF